MMRSRISIVALAAVLALAAAACGGSDGGAGGWTDVDAPELASMMDEGGFVLINVHVPYEGELPKTDAFIPYDEIGNRLSELPANKDAKIVLYCLSGRMSTEAAGTLTSAGYTNVYNLAGGWQAWTAAGYELLQGTPTG